MPAHRWASSDHDSRLGRRRRYTRRLLVDVINRAGFEVVHATYFHSWLVVPAFLMRRTPLRFLVRGAAEEASYVGPAVNRALTGVVALERRCLRRFPLPFGLSILAVARVPTA